ncbi:MAG TPA: sensor histidine kinase, partial [Patescibacteria group bacterium]|nr:sensor histidine kinase [Patescibacteria group bacterium]
NYFGYDRFSELFVNPVFRGNEVTGVVVFDQDITEYQQALNEKNGLLKSAMEHHENMLKAILDTQEQERKRISQDLHDGLGQILSAAKLTLTSGIDEVRELVDEQLIEKAEYGISLLNSAIEETRSISRQIMPSALMHFGLESALKDLFKTVSSKEKFEVNYYFKISSPLEKLMEIHLYRIVQEFLNNTIKHSDATELTVNLIEEDQFLTLMMEDNGLGFDVGIQLQKNSLGLKNMMTRANYLSAGISIDSVPGHGCTITLDIPLTKQY